MTRANALRAYIEAHPNQTGRQIAEALGMDRHTCTNHLANMARRGTLTATGDRLERTYAIGRALVKEWNLPPGEAEERARIRRREHSRRVRAAAPKGLRPLLQDLVSRKPVQVSIPGESSHEWEARGGRVEKLPGCRYVPARVMPMGARY